MRPVHHPHTHDTPQRLQPHTQHSQHPRSQPYQSPARLSESIRKWLKKAGIGKSAHSVRKLGATMLADLGADLVIVRDFLGHTSFAEAEIYIRNRDKRRVSARAVELMDIVRAAKATA